MNVFRVRNAAMSAVAAVLFGVTALPVVAAEADVAKQLSNAKHTLVQVLQEVSKNGEVPIEAKYEMDKDKLLVGAYTATKGLGVIPEKNEYKEYNGDSTGAAWKPEVEVFKDAEHLTRSASYATLMSMTKVSLLDIANKAATDGRGAVFEIKPVVENGTPVFAVMVAQNGTPTRLTYDLLTGARKG